MPLSMEEQLETLCTAKRSFLLVVCNIREDNDYG